jgi:hypothetical protein
LSAWGWVACSLLHFLTLPWALAMYASSHGTSGEEAWDWGLHVAEQAHLLRVSGMPPTIMTLKVGGFFSNE